MKKTLLFFISLLTSSLLLAQSTNYRVVFDLTSKDSIDQKSVIRWVSEVTANNPDAKTEVVMFGMGTAIALKDRSLVADEVSKLVANKNVSFKICAIAMKNQHLVDKDLIAGVQIVPDGIYEIISRQRDGWGYIKVSH